jgi:L-fuconolactonase
MSAAAPVSTPSVDAHVHLWDTERLHYPWLDDVPLPRRVDAAALIAAAGPGTGFVLVQADCVGEQGLAEIAWLSEQAALLPEVLGIVGYAPLHSPVATAAHLRALRRFPLVVGVRRLIQDEPPGFTSRPGLRAGVALLAAEDLVFDLCVREPQLGEVVDLVRATPEVRFVLDHLGKPRVGADPTRWRRDLRALADLPNVVAKLSGLMTEIIPGTGAADDVRPYLEYALAVFGPQRCLFGSDWPVLTLAGSYAHWRDTVLDAVAGLSEAEVEAVLHGNARALYRPRRLPSNPVDPMTERAVR